MEAAHGHRKDGRAGAGDRGRALVTPPSTLSDALPPSMTVMSRRGGMWNQVGIAVSLAVW